MDLAPNVIITWQTAFWTVAGFIPIILGFSWKTIKYNLDSQLKRADNIEREIQNMKDMHALKEDVIKLERDIKFLQENHVSKEELKLFMAQLDRSITESGMQVRDGLQRVHLRIDDIYKQLWGNGK